MITDGGNLRNADLRHAPPVSSRIDVASTINGAKILLPLQPGFCTGFAVEKEIF
jgi:hypothetical protein